MLAEVLIFVPSVANFRISWLTDRLTAARLAALATQDRARGQRARSAAHRAAAHRAGARRLLDPQRPAAHGAAARRSRPSIDDIYDLRPARGPAAFWSDVVAARAPDLGRAGRVLRRRRPHHRGGRRAGGRRPDRHRPARGGAEGGDDPLRPQHPGPVHHHLGHHRRARLFRAQQHVRAADDAHHAQHPALQPEPGGREPHHRALAAPATRSASPSATWRTCRAS